jgi:hypothetical protein
MCVVIPPAVAFAASALSAAGTAVQQAQNQRRQVSYQEKMGRMTSLEAGSAADLNYAANAERMVQTRQAAAMEAWDAARAADRTAGQMVVGGEMMGRAQSSLSDLRYSIAQKAAEDAAMRVRNQSWQESQIARGFDQVAAEQRSRINAAMPQSVAGVDWAGLMGNLVQAGAQYSDAMDRRNFNRAMVSRGVPYRDQYF